MRKPPPIRSRSAGRRRTRVVGLCLSLALIGVSQLGFALSRAAGQLVSAAPAPAPPASKRIRHRTIDMSCPEGTQRHVRQLNRRDAAGLSVGVEQAYIEVRCVLPDGTPHGPIAQLRRFMLRRISWLKRSPVVPATAVVRTGWMRRGRRDGTWLQLDAAGRQLGSFTLQAGTGTWVVWHRRGPVAIIGGLRDDQRTGLWRYRFGNGVLAVEGRYAADQRHGLWRWFYASGVPLRAIVFKRGQRHGLYTQWWHSGNKRMEGTYDHGLRDGTWLRWGQSGRLHGLISLTRGDGVWVDWHTDGTLRAAGPVRSDKRSGHWREWDEQGVLRAEGDYKAGARVEPWKRYRDDGTPVGSRGGARGARAGRGGSPPAARRAAAVRALRGLRFRSISRSSGSLRVLGGRGGSGVSAGVLRGGAAGSGVGGGGAALGGSGTPPRPMPAAGSVRSVSIAWSSPTPGMALKPNQQKLLSMLVHACARRLRFAGATPAPRVRGGARPVATSQGRRPGRKAHIHRKSGPSARQPRAATTSTLLWRLDVLAVGRVVRVKRLQTPTGLIDRRGLACADFAVQHARFMPMPPGKPYTVTLSATLHH